MAKSVKCLITPEVLKWAREKVTLSLDDAAKKITVSKEKIEAWEEGKDQPTVNQLKKMAKIYRRHFSIFYLPEKPLDFKPLQDYRTFLYTTVYPEDEYRLMANIIEAHQKRDLTVELYNLLEIPFQKIPLSITSTDDEQNVAKKIRRFLDVSDNDIFKLKDEYEALKFWKHKIENKGILVLQTSANSHLTVDLRAMRGFCISEQRLPVIVVNSKDNPFSRIFTLLHELVHILLGESEIQNTDFRNLNTSALKPIEVFCNKVAAEVLVPSETLLREEVVKNVSGKEDWNPATIRALACKFSVNSEVILRKLLTLGKTTDEFYENYRNLQRKKYDSLPKKTSGYADYYKKVINACGEHLTKLAFSAFYSEKITITDLSHILSDCNVKNINNVERAIFSR